MPAPTTRYFANAGGPKEAFYRIATRSGLTDQASRIPLARARCTLVTRVVAPSSSGTSAVLAKLPMKVAASSFACSISSARRLLAPAPAGHAPRWRTRVGVGAGSLRAAARFLHKSISVRGADLGHSFWYCSQSESKCLIVGSMRSRAAAAAKHRSVSK